MDVDEAPTDPTTDAGLPNRQDLSAVERGLGDLSIASGSSVGLQALPPQTRTSKRLHESQDVVLETLDSEGSVNRIRSVTRVVESSDSIRMQKDIDRLKQEKADQVMIHGKQMTRIKDQSRDLATQLAEEEETRKSLEQTLKLTQEQKGNLQKEVLALRSTQTAPPRSTDEPQGTNGEPLLNTLQHALNGATQMKTQLSAELETLREQLKNQHGNVETEMSHTIEDEKQLREQIAQLTQSQQKLSNSASFYLKTSEALKAEAKELADKLKPMEALALSREAETKRLRSELRKVNTQFNEESSKWDGTLKILGSKLEVAERLSLDSQEPQATNETDQNAQIQLTDLSNSLSKLEKEMSDVQKEHDTFKQQLTEATALNAALANESQGLKQRMQTGLAQLTSHEEELRRLRQENEELTTKYAPFNEVEAGLRAQIVVLQERAQGTDVRMEDTDAPQDQALWVEFQMWKAKTSSIPSEELEGQAHHQQITKLKTQSELFQEVTALTKRLEAVDENPPVHTGPSQADLDQLQHDNEKLVQKLSAAEQREAALEATIKDLESHREYMEIDLQDANEKAKEVSEEPFLLEQLQKELKAARDKEAELTQSEAKWKVLAGTTQATLEEALERTSVQLSLDLIQETIHLLQSNLETRRVEVRDKNDKLREAQDTHDKLQDTYVQQTRQLEAAEGKVWELEGKEEIQTLKQRVQVLQKEVQVIVMERDDLKVQLSETNVRYEHLTTVHAELVTRRDAIEEKYKSMLTKAQGIEKKYLAMKQTNHRANQHAERTAPGLQSSLQHTEYWGDDDDDDFAFEPLQTSRRSAPIASPSASKLESIDSVTT
ncbi:hypothetical protein EUX98_g9450 [Antrodiella citrinella]|uniref:Uncharacterized protein n=1 Tax=Antrodiella citrinella TaxID=2447956 RepID=A0A4S4LTI4_9APHY|nr:hypothetical protein EUX98_g9450 [Antrodiella citrinella]